MKPTPLGAFVAGALSAGTRMLGVFLYYALRIAYRPRERLIALGVLAGIVALIVLFVWIA